VSQNRTLTANLFIYPSTPAAWFTHFQGHFLPYLLASYLASISVAYCIRFYARISNCSRNSAAKQKVKVTQPAAMSTSLTARILRIRSVDQR